MWAGVSQPADRIQLFRFDTIPMRAFHCAWASFFLCFFGWFGLAPLMATIRDDLGLTKDQVANTALASVAGTIVARLLFGWLCDRIGPRISYALLLMVGAIPVMAIGLAQSYESFLLIRLAIGTIGASFVITFLPLAVMLGATAIVALRTGVLPKWLGWGAAVVAFGLLGALAAAIVSPSPPGWVFLPMMLFALWIAATSIALIRRAGEPHLVETTRLPGEPARVR